MKSIDKEMKRVATKTDRIILSVVIGTCAAILLALICIWLSSLMPDNPETCTCRFQQHRVHFGDQYTKVNKECWQNGHGDVVVGDSVYLDVAWFANDCE